MNFKSPWIRLTCGGLLLLFGVAFGTRWWFDRQLVLAQQSMDERDWLKARERIGDYLKFRPGDSQARLMLAEAFIRDNKFDGDKVELALQQLALIPDQAPRAAEARLQEGRLLLLLRLQPGRAERAFLQSIHIDPTRIEAHALLWRLYVLTNRWDSAEPYFWTVHDHASEAERVNLLRDWYLSEFSPGTANVDLERRIGLLGPSELPGTDSDLNRLEAFVTAEPDWLDGYAILARWHLRYGALTQADRRLEQVERLPGGGGNPLVIATRVFVSLELGQFDQALKAFEKWPIPHSGYEYNKAAGLIADQVSKDLPHACDAYQRAIETTAGKSDWLTQHRLDQCLMRMGKLDQAVSIRTHSKVVELLMETTIHANLRRALLTPRAPESIELIVDLYQKLGRDREVAAWKQFRSEPDQASCGVPATDAVLRYAKPGFDIALPDWRVDAASLPILCWVENVVAKTDQSFHSDAVWASENAMLFPFYNFEFLENETR